MAGVIDRPERSLDVVPAALVLQPSPDQLGDVGTAPAFAGSPVQLRDEIVVHRNVQPHVLRLAHTMAHRAPAGGVTPSMCAERGLRVARALVVRAPGPPVWELPETGRGCGRLGHVDDLG